MNIILYKDDLYNTQKLYDEVNSLDFLDGFILSSTITNDGKIIVSNFKYNANIYTSNLQEENYDELKYNIFYKIEDFLEDFKDYKGKIILNLVGAPNIIGEPNKNYEFVLNLKKIFSNYKHLNIYVCSIYDDIITYCMKQLNDIKIGMVVNEGNLNYYDVDFYLFPARILDTKIVAQQLKLKKEIMIILNSSEEIVNITDSFKKTSYLFDDLNENISNKLLYILTSSPKVINVYLNSKRIN